MYPKLAKKSCLHGAVDGILYDNNYNQKIVDSMMSLNTISAMHASVVGNLRSSFVLLPGLLVRHTHPCPL